MGLGRGLWERVWKPTTHTPAERDEVSRGGPLGGEGNVRDTAFNVDPDVPLTVKQKWRKTTLPEGTRHTQEHGGGK